MDRKQAIRHIEGLEDAAASEFYVTAAEREAGRAELTEALEALGVTAAEREAAWQ